MNKSALWRIFAVVVIATMALAACSTSATPTAEVAPTEAPAVEEATEAPAVEEPTEAPAVEEATEAPAEETAATPLVVGLVMIGPYNDGGWSQAHYDSVTYAISKMDGAEMIYIDNANSSSRPGTSQDQLAEELVAQGANLIVFSSDDMKDAAILFAQNHPDIPVIFASGDTVWKDGENYQDLPNMKNFMGRMEYGKMLAGCSAALTTQTGKIGYLGPLENAETRRLASSAYLGAKYCWTQVLGKDAAELTFNVTWIGYWFNLPGTTLDPSQVADNFFNTGFDVVISGIDTTEALTEAKKMSDSGSTVYAVSYDFKEGCASAPDVCLGVPYFNWSVDYLQAFQEFTAGNWTSSFSWDGPDWADINNADTSSVGFVKGDALSADASTQLDQFITELGGGLNLWTGPINLIDGTEYLADGVAATDQQIWYLPQLLEGMGASTTIE